MCFLCFSIWVVCFLSYLWEDCPDILWKVVVLMVLPLIITPSYHPVCLHLFPKWEPGLTCGIYLETHNLLNSIIFMFFPFGWHTTGSEEMVCRYKWSPSNVSVVWKGKFTKVFGWPHPPILRLRVTMIKVLEFCVLIDPLFRVTALSYVFLGSNSKTKINTSVSICTVLCCLHKLWKMGTEFLVSRVRELHIHTLIRWIWEFPRVCQFVPVDLPSVITNSLTLSLKKEKKLRWRRGSGEKGRFYC